MLPSFKYASTTDARELHVEELPESDFSWISSLQYLQSKDDDAGLASVHVSNWWTERLIDYGWVRSEGRACVWSHVNASHLEQVATVSIMSTFITIDYSHVLFCLVNMF